MARFSKKFLRIIKLPPQFLYAIGLGRLYGRIVLLLTTRGRKSGLARVTPLQYEEIDGAIYVASARGDQADWFRNIVADPRVEIRVHSRRFSGIGEPVTDNRRVTDFIEYRLKRHPRMVGTIMRLEGLPKGWNRADVERYAAQRAMVIIRPFQPGSAELGE